MRQAHQTRPGNDTTYQGCFWNSQSTLFPHVCGYCKGCYKRGPNLWQEHHHKAKDAPRGTKKGGRKFTSIWDRWQNDENYRESQLAIGWSDAWMRDLDHVTQIDIYHKAPQEQRSRYHNLLYVRSVHEDRQAPLLSQRRGYQKQQRAHKSKCKGNRDKIWESHLTQKVKGGALIISSILHCKGTLSG